MMALFCQKSGSPVAVLLDDGYLTNLRTAIAGAICAKYLAPLGHHKIGIVGAGIQARAQLQLLKYVTENREVFVWAKSPAQTLRYQSDPELREFNIQVSPTLDHLTQNCKLIVTTTPSSTPLLRKEYILPGTHITAVGADRPGKQELDAELFSLADRVVVDSRSQCFAYGDTSHALKAKTVSEDKISELGEIIENASLHRQSNQEITISDLTGLGVQDLKIAEGVFEKLLKASESSERRIMI